MNEFMEQYWSFYHAGVTIFLFAGLALLIKIVFFKRKRRKKEPHLKFKHWNHRFENDFERLEKELHVAPFLPKEAIKLLMKARKKEVKEEKRKDKEKSVKTISTIREKLKDGLNSEEVLKQHSNCVYVLTFIGSIMASEVEQLRDQISFLLQIAQPADEIVVRLTSPGGAVPQYGLASSQLERLKQAGLRCVVCVDTVAASGGYMMAAVADKSLLPHLLLSVPLESLLVFLISTVFCKKMRWIITYLLPENINVQSRLLQKLPTRANKNCRTTLQPFMRHLSA